MTAAIRKSDGTEYKTYSFYKCLSTAAVSISKSVRPVINLKANIEFIGSGTIDGPYIINTDTN